MSKRLYKTSCVISSIAVVSLGFAGCSADQSDEPAPSISARPDSLTSAPVTEASSDAPTSDEPQTATKSDSSSANNQSLHTETPAPGHEQPSKDKQQEQNHLQSQSGRSKADFPYYTYGRTGTAPSTEVNRTTPEFGRAVYDAFIEHWIATGDSQPVLEVVSPANGNTYSMSCSANDHSVLCTGGVGAKVYIYRPIDDSVTKPWGLQYG